MSIINNIKKISGKIFGTSVVFVIILFIVAILISIFRKKGDDYSSTQILLDKIQDKLADINIKREEIKKEKEKIKNSVDSIKTRHEARKEKAKKYIKDV